MKKTIIGWVTGGILLVTAAFFIPEQSGSMWSSVILGCLAAFLYLIAFSFVWLRKIESPVKRKAIRWALGILMVFSFISAALSYESSSRQSELLSAIRTNIENNIAEIYTKEPLLKTLRAYHLEKKSNDISIGSLFKTKYDSLIGRDCVFSYGTLGEESTLMIYLSQLSPDTVSLVAESRYIDGNDPGFKNFSGSTGLFQTQGILTSEGVHYERRN